MVVLCVVGFVENKQVDLGHGDERVHQALCKDFCSAYDDHVLGEIRVPGRFVPQAGTHSTADGFNALVEATSENVCLLKDKVDRVDLSDVSTV